MASDGVEIRVSVEGGRVVLERLTGTAPRHNDKRKLHTEIKTLDGFRAMWGTAYYLVKETWGIEPHLVTFVDGNGDELHPD